MSDNTRQKEFFEAIKQQAITENDAAKLEFANTKLAELEASSGTVAVAADPTPKVFEHVQKYGMDFDAYAETGSNILNEWAEFLINSLRHELHTRYQDQIEQLTGKANSLTLENDALVSTNESLETRFKQEVEEKNKYKLEAADYQSRFEAAVMEREEDKAEIERLKRRESEFQEKLARKTAIEQQTVIDVPADVMDPEALIRKAQEIKNAKHAKEEQERKDRLVKVTNIRWEDFYERNYLAELVLDGELGKAGDTIKFGRLEKGKYLEVSAEDAARFREAQPVQEATTPDIPLAVTVPEIAPVTVDQFRNGGEQVDQAATGAEDTGATGSVPSDEAVSETVSRSEFEAFKKDVERKFEELMGDVA